MLTSLDQPGRAERFRCALARHIFLRHLWGLRLALRLAPKNHPWRTLMQSAFDSQKDMTYVTLRPRTAYGAVTVERRGGPHLSPRVRFARAAVLYLVVADLVGFVPGIGLMPAAAGIELQPMHRVGLLDQPSRVDLSDYVTFRSEAPQR